MKCQHCPHTCIKAGFQKNGTQKFYCKTCKRYQQSAYCYKAYQKSLNKIIASMLTEGVGIRGIARLNGISITTAIKRIRLIAKKVTKPVSTFKNCIYEMDELWTYVGKKANETWVMYLIDRKTKEVVDFRVGPRAKENLQQLTNQALQMHATKVCTDGLNTYRSLLPNLVHRVGNMCTRHIERHNLNLRTHLKRLARKTICFTKSHAMLEACLRIYFWGRISTFNSPC